MKKTLSLFLVGVITMSTLAWCTNVSTPESKWPETVKIWVIAPMSWPAANYGEDAVHAYQYIVDKFNSENSWKIQMQLVIEDGKCEWKSASSAAQKLIWIDKVQVIVGWFCSAETIAAGTIAQPNKVVMISAVSSSPDIANIGDYIFRFYNDSYVTKKLSNYIQSLWANKVFVLAENTDVSVGFLEWLKTSFTGKIESQMYQKEEKDFPMIAKQIKSKIHESDFLIFLPSSDESTIGIINAFDNEWILSMMKRRIASNEIVNSATSYKALWTKLDGIKTTQLINLWSLPSSAQDLEKNMLTHFSISSDPLRAVLEGDAMQLTLDAVKKVGNDGEKIKNYFTSYTSANPRKGYFWDYYFTPERDAHGLNFLVYEMKDGKLVNGK